MNGRVGNLVSHAGHAALHLADCCLQQYNKHVELLKIFLLTYLSHWRAKIIHRELLRGVAVCKGGVFLFTVQGKGFRVLFADKPRHLESRIVSDRLKR